MASSRGPEKGRGGARELLGRPSSRLEAAGRNRGGGNPWRRRPARTPVELEVEDDCQERFAKIEKFSGSTVKQNFPVF
jgi:hypothetical protein